MVSGLTVEAGDDFDDAARSSGDGKNSGRFSTSPRPPTPKPTMGPDQRYFGAGGGRGRKGDTMGGAVKGEMREKGNAARVRIPGRSFAGSSRVGLSVPLFTMLRCRTFVLEPRNAQKYEVAMTFLEAP